jgi:hypothetical protein
VAHLRSSRGQLACPLTEGTAAVGREFRAGGGVFAGQDSDGRGFVGEESKAIRDELREIQIQLINVKTEITNLRTLLAANGKDYGEPFTSSQPPNRTMN